ncbi:MAG: chemotaxis protein CheW [Hydrogenoanaerobacterium sp.]
MENTNLQAISQTIVQTDSSEMDGKYLTFWIDKQLFGVPIAYVVQIVGMQNITEVPEFPSFAKGIINLRGAIIPLIDVRMRIGKLEADYNERTCIIVTDINSSNVGFIVDEVDAVTSIPNESIAPPPMLSGCESSYITGIGKMENKVVLLMDTRKIVGEEDLNILTASQV